MPTTKQAPPQALSLYFSELKNTSRLFEMSQTVIQNTEMCRSEVYAMVLWGLPRYLEPISFLKVLQTSQAQSTECVVLPLLKAIPSLNSAQLTTTNLYGFCKTQAKIQQGFLFFQETLYRDRENVWLMKESRKFLYILRIIQTAPVSTS